MNRRAFLALAAAAALSVTPLASVPACAEWIDAGPEAAARLVELLRQPGLGVCMKAALVERRPGQWIYAGRLHDGRLHAMLVDQIDGRPVGSGAWAAGQFRAIAAWDGTKFYLWSEP